MVKTQIQLPDHLFREAKRIAAEYEMSFAEVVRRSLERTMPGYPPKSSAPWHPPEPLDLGPVSPPLKTGACSPTNSLPKSPPLPAAVGQSLPAANDFARHQHPGYAANSAAVEHPQARAFVDRLEAEGAEVVLCELMLVEFYNLLRNPAIFARPATAAAAAAPSIPTASIPAGDSWIIRPDARLAEPLWRAAASPSFPGAASTTPASPSPAHHGVTEFATANVKDFEGFGFTRVWNPLGA